MKRYGNIYSKIYDIDNLREAHKQARKGKAHYRDVKMVNKNPDKYLYKIQRMLKNKTYKTSEYEIFNIVDKGKEREIYKLPYSPDRIVHWAIMLQIEDILLKNLVHDTYAALPNKGIHKALTRIHEFMEDKEGTQYCLKLDVKKFFPSIDKEILKKMFRKKFKDNELLWILDEIIDSNENGVPIGNYLSQYFGNFYLSYFDHWLKEDKGIKYYARYMDDCVIFHHDKHFLHQLKNEIESYLKAKLNLKLKENWQVFPTYVRGVDFVGYRSFGDYTLLRKSTSKRLKRKMIKINKKPRITKNDMQSVNSYRGWLIHCNAYNLEKKYILPLIKRYKEEDTLKSQSSIKPNPIWIQEIKNGSAKIRLRNNIKEVVNVDHESDQVTIFEYDELTINLTNRSNLEEYVTTNFDKLYNVALDKIKKDKLNELNKACEKEIFSHFKHNVNEAYYYFSNDNEAQKNFDKGQVNFTNGYLPSLKWTAYDMNWNVVRLDIDAVIFEELYKAHLNHIQINIAKYRDELMPLVTNATSGIEVDAITWE